MTDSLATKQDLSELQARLDARFTQIDGRFEHLERQFDIRFVEFEKRIALRFEELENRFVLRFNEQTASFDGKLADLERRLTIRLGGMMVAGIGVLAALRLV